MSQLFSYGEVKRRIEYATNENCDNRLLAFVRVRECLKNNDTMAPEASKQLLNRFDNIIKESKMSALWTLNLLQMCVKFCGDPFVVGLNRDRVLSTLTNYTCHQEKIKMANLQIQLKLFSLIQQWSEDFAGFFSTNHFELAYREIIKRGFMTNTKDLTYLHWIPNKDVFGTKIDTKIYNVQEISRLITTQCDVSNDEVKQIMAIAKSLLDMKRSLLISEKEQIKKYFLRVTQIQSALEEDLSIWEDIVMNLDYAPENMPVIVEQTVRVFKTMNQSIQHCLEYLRSLSLNDDAPSVGCRTFSEPQPPSFQPEPTVPAVPMPPLFGQPTIKTSGIKCNIWTCPLCIVEFSVKCDLLAHFKTPEHIRELQSRFASSKATTQYSKQPEPMAVSNAIYDQVDTRAGFRIPSTSQPASVPIVLASATKPVSFLNSSFHQHHSLPKPDFSYSPFASATKPVSSSNLSIHEHHSLPKPDINYSPFASATKPVSSANSFIHQHHSLPKPDFSYSQFKGYKDLTSGQQNLTPRFQSDVYESKIFNCSTCNCSFDDQRSWQDHLSSPQHRTQQMEKTKFTRDHSANRQYSSGRFPASSSTNFSRDHSATRQYSSGRFPASTSQTLVNVSSPFKTVGLKPSSSANILPVQALHVQLSSSKISRTDAIPTKSIPKGITIAGNGGKPSLVRGNSFRSIPGKNISKLAMLFESGANLHAEDEQCVTAEACEIGHRNGLNSTADSQYGCSFCQILLNQSELYIHLGSKEHNNNLPNQPATASTVGWRPSIGPQNSSSQPSPTVDTNFAQNRSEPRVVSSIGSALMSSIGSANSMQNRREPQVVSSTAYALKSSISSTAPASGWRSLIGPQNSSSQPSPFVDMNLAQNRSEPRVVSSIGSALMSSIGSANSMQNRREPQVVSSTAYALMSSISSAAPATGWRSSIGPQNSLFQPLPSVNTNPVPTRRQPLVVSSVASTLLSSLGTVNSHRQSSGATHSILAPHYDDMVMANSNGCDAAIQANPDEIFHSQKPLPRVAFEFQQRVIDDSDEEAGTVGARILDFGETAL